MLLPYDLTRGGGQFNFIGHTDVKELALYVQDQIKAGNWLFNVGIRGDLYNGLDDRTSGGASPRRVLQRQADQHRPSRLLRTHARVSLQ